MRVKTCLPFLLFLAVSCLVSCNPQPLNTNVSTTIVTSPTIVISPIDTTRQKTVDVLKSLLAKYPPLPTYVINSPRLEGWLDVNEYFKILNHLSMQPGYVLDYVYNNNGSSGLPYLYARKIDDEPFISLDELYQTYTDKKISHLNDYLNSVGTDDTEESYFQYVVLRIMGGQFFLWWHAAYNDNSIVCDKVGLETILTSKYHDISIPSEIQNKARKLELSPKIQLTENTAIVKLVTFTKWGGFSEEQYTISRSFPHLVQEIQKKTLVEWHIGIYF